MFLPGRDQEAVELSDWLALIALAHHEMLQLCGNFDTRRKQMEAIKLALKLTCSDHHTCYAISFSNHLILALKCIRKLALFIILRFIKVIKLLTAVILCVFYSDVCVFGFVRVA